MNLPDEIFIVVTEYNISFLHDHSRTSPLAWETRLYAHGSKDKAIERIALIGNSYGNAII
jgi:hypothetical protein